MKDKNVTEKLTKLEAQIFSDIKDLQGCMKIKIMLQ